MGLYDPGYYIEHSDGTTSKRMSKIDACNLVYFGGRVICAHRKKGWLGWEVTTVPTILVEKYLYDEANEQMGLRNTQE